MSHEIHEITELQLRLDPDRSDALLEYAGQWDSYPNVPQALMDFFGFLDLEDDGTVNSLRFDWWEGRDFDDEYAFLLLAAAAGPDDYLFVWDARDGTKDAYWVVFDGKGGYEQRYVISDGLPVGALPPAMLRKTRPSTRRKEGRRPAGWHTGFRGTSTREVPRASAGHDTAAGVRPTGETEE